MNNSQTPISSIRDKVDGEAHKQDNRETRLQTLESQIRAASEQFFSKQSTAWGLLYVISLTLIISVLGPFLIKWTNEWLSKPLDQIEIEISEIKQLTETIQSKQKSAGEDLLRQLDDLTQRLDMFESQAEKTPNVEANETSNEP